MQRCEQLCFMNRRRRVENALRKVISNIFKCCGICDFVPDHQNHQSTRDKLFEGLFSIFSHSQGGNTLCHVECLASQAELLRLAIARARRVGVELEQAEQLLQDEREAWTAI